MRLFIKMIPLRAGTSELAGEHGVFECPADVEPDTILSFLTQTLGDVIETIWTWSERHERIDVGWVFAAPDAEWQGVVDFACVPLLQTADGLRPVFVVQSDQRREFADVADGRGLDYTVIRGPQRVYQPSVRSGTGAARGESRPPSNLDEVLPEIARDAGATLHAYPRPSPAARRVVLQDERDDRGTRYLEAALDEGGTLTIIGRDQGPGVSEFFGSGITGYEWIYVVPSDRVPVLTTMLTDDGSGDVLTLLAAYYHRAPGQISDLLRHPDVAAEFNNWHS